MIVLIPAYQPDERLVVLARTLRTGAPAAHVVVVDDGSGPRYSEIFGAVAALGCTVVAHATNRGKGAALRTGLAHLAPRHPGQDVVCADCDGQHTAADILEVARRVRTSASMVLGARDFSGAVPLPSRLGNTATRRLFALATGRHLRDTQTGLRGYPAHELEWLTRVPGDRFEYELTVLLRAARSRRPIIEVPISTIYLEGNASSHFRPLVDSVRVYAPLLLFSASSLLAFAVDTSALLLVSALTGSLLVSVVGARAISSTVNFLTNRAAVFPRTDVAWRVAAARYWALVLALLAANYLLMASLTGIGLPLLAAKLVTEPVLFAAGYAAQRRVVFASRRPVVSLPVEAPRPGADEAPSAFTPRPVLRPRAGGR